EVSSVTLSSAPLTMPSIAIERRASRASSFSNTCPLGRVTSCSSAALTAGVAHGTVLTPRNGIAPEGLTWYCSASRPETNTALPEAEMQVSSDCSLLDNARSPSRPPQPIVEPSLPSACQKLCWSLCENSLGGSGYFARSGLLYSASVSGVISEPTLDRKSVV